MKRVIGAGSGEPPVKFFLLLILAACTSRSTVTDVSVIAVDYAFQTPRKLTPGLKAFTLTNRGKVLHEFQLFRLRPDLPREEALAQLTAAENTDSLSENGAGSVLWAPPGVTTHERVLVDMSAGETYALLCAFRDADSLPQHIQLGMVAVLEVD